MSFDKYPGVPHSHPLGWPLISALHSYTHSLLQPDGIVCSALVKCTTTITSKYFSILPGIQNYCIEVVIHLHQKFP